MAPVIRHKERFNRENAVGGAGSPQAYDAPHEIEGLDTAAVEGLAEALAALAPKASPQFSDRTDLATPAFFASLRDDGTGNLGLYVGPAGAADGAQILVASFNKTTGVSTFQYHLSSTGFVETTGSSYQAFQATGGDVQGQLAANFGGTVDIRAVSNHPMTFHTNNIERMRIGASGNVGIGMSAPHTTFVVAGLDMNAFKWAEFSGSAAGVRLGGVDAFGRIDAITPGGTALAPLAIVSAGIYVDTYLVPTPDNVHALGAPSNRWSVIYAATGTINTSDAREKTPVRLLTEAERAAARDLRAEIGAFQWLDAIEKKGEGDARDHIGMTVQRAIEIMESHGLDPWRYGFICRDEITRRVTVMQTKRVQATETVDEPYTEIEIRDGVPVQVQKTRTVQRPMVEMVAVIDGGGNPVEHGGKPLMHPVPIMIERDVEVEIDEPAGDRLAFRPDQLAFFMLAGLASPAAE